MSPWDVLGWLLVIVIGVPVAIVVVVVAISAVFVAFSFVVAMCIGMVERLKAHKRRMRASVRMEEE